MGVILAGVSLSLWCPKNVQVDFRFPLAPSVFLDAFSVICLTLVQKIAVETAALLPASRLAHPSSLFCANRASGISLVLSRFHVGSESAARSSVPS
jgi:hypothetical protein